MTWNGLIDNIAPDVDTLRLWLGIDGSGAGPDIGDNSHNWRTMQLTNTEDEGSLAGAFTDFAEPFPNDITIVTDPNFGGGAHDCWNFPTSGVTSRFGMGLSNSVFLPDPMDGTRSLINGIICQIDATTVSETLTSIFSDSIGSARGHYIYFWKNVGGANGGLRAVLDWGAAEVLLEDTINISDGAGSPLVIFHNLDFAAGLRKLIVASQGATAIVTVALSDIGSFDNGSTTRVGGTLISNWSSMEGKVAQVFTFDYDAALDAEFGIDNMERFLSFTQTLGPPVVVPPFPAFPIRRGLFS